MPREKRRFARWGRSHRTAAVALTSVALLAAPALAETVVLDNASLTGGGPGTGSLWNMSNAEEAYDQCMIQNAPALEIDANVHDSSFDVFDGGVSFQVGNEAFYDSNGNGTQEGRNLRAGPENVGPLDVTLFHKSFADFAVLRSLLRLQNPTNQAVTRAVYFDSAHGNTMDLRASQSGDLAWTRGDRWILISDYPEPARPWASYAFYGPGQPERRVRSILYKPWEEPDYCVTVEYRVTIPANSTRYLAVLTRLIDNSVSLSNARDQARRFRGPDGFFVGLSDRIKNKIVNWDL